MEEDQVYQLLDSASDRVTSIKELIKTVMTVTLSGALQEDPEVAEEELFDCVKALITEVKELRQELFDIADAYSHIDSVYSAEAREVTDATWQTVARLVSSVRVFAASGEAALREMLIGTVKECIRHLSMVTGVINEPPDWVAPEVTVDQAEGYADGLHYTGDMSDIGSVSDFDDTYSISSDIVGYRDEVESLDYLLKRQPSQTVSIESLSSSFGSLFKQQPSSTEIPLSSLDKAIENIEGEMSTDQENSTVESVLLQEIMHLRKLFDRYAASIQYHNRSSDALSDEIRAYSSRFEVMLHEIERDTPIFVRDFYLMLLDDFKGAMEWFLQIGSNISDGLLPSSSFIEPSQTLIDACTRFEQLLSSPFNREWIYSLCFRLVLQAKTILEMAACTSPQLVQEMKLIVEHVNLVRHIATKYMESIPDEMLQELIYCEVGQLGHDMSSFFREIKMLLDEGLDDSICPTFMDLEECRNLGRRFMVQCRKFESLYSFCYQLVETENQLLEHQRQSHARISEFGQTHIYWKSLEGINETLSGTYKIAQSAIRTRNQQQIVDSIKEYQKSFERNWGSIQYIYHTTIDEAFLKGLNELAELVLRSYHEFFHQISNVPTLSEDEDLVGGSTIFMSQVLSQAIKLADHLVQLFVEIAQYKPELEVKPQTVAVFSEASNIYEELGFDGSFTGDASIKMPVGDMVDVTVDQMFWMVCGPLQKIKIDHFLTTAESYISGTEMLEKLLALYNGPFAETPEIKEWKSRNLNSVQIHAIQAIEKGIIQNIIPPHSGVDKKLRAMADALSGDDRKRELITQVCDRVRKINQLSKSHLQVAVPKKSELSAEYAPSKVMRKSDPDQLAQLLCLVDMEGFVSIQVGEFFDQSWNSKDKTRAPNIKRMIKRFNEVSDWISSIILWTGKIKKRVKLIEKILKLSQRLLAYRNYNAVFAIQSALKSSPIYRLTHSWNDVSDSCKEVESMIPEIACFSLRFSPCWYCFPHIL
eukprot:TRINITY_DN4264_c0_g1_i3.p1 TRINITY_DN4264_c0_g1~~TRINITY_DN4264_c0_g1_i3.p1  ORF type:complete len:987 (-),score=205.13 TRINITY_DN4264_c0_g1_i3:687-3647(-)